MVFPSTGFSANTYFFHTDVLPSERKTSFLNKKKQSVDLIGADFLYWKVLKKRVVVYSKFVLFQSDTCI